MQTVFVQNLKHLGFNRSLLKPVVSLIFNTNIIVFCTTKKTNLARRTGESRYPAYIGISGHRLSPVRHMHCTQKFVMNFMVSEEV